MNQLFGWTYVINNKRNAGSMKKATFGAGCFWGLQAAFDKLKGVVFSEVGYTGGTTSNPSYKEVCTGKTGHAEVVQLIYDSNIISYEELLDEFWDIHNPTLLNQQGMNVGDQYRSVIFYHTKDQKKTAEKSLEEQQKSGKYDSKIATQIEPAVTFYPAEEKHQKYLENQNLSQSK